jgi:phospho-N-acetylmuramoyl-pentapeptide-transferase
MEQELLYRIILPIGAALVTFFLTCVVMTFLLPILKRCKMNQPISEYAPKSHIKKGGTPTLGGLAFVLASIFTVAAASVALLLFKKGTELLPMLLTFGLALFNSAIGILDDYRKLAQKHNIGLRAWQKLLLQLIFAAIYLVLMTRLCGLTTVVRIPYVNVSLDLGLFYYPLALLLITGIINSTNLTDGVDGLLSSTSAVVSVFFLVLALKNGNTAASVLPAIVLGSVIAFLLYNAHPARVFMGDTGSLYIGALFVGVSFMLNEPLIVLIAGGIYVIETASVILQVLSCKLIRLKLRKKRFFLRTPIHHHFEDKGYSENQVVVLFTVLSALFSFLAWLGVLG